MNGSTLNVSLPCLYVSNDRNIESVSGILFGSSLSNSPLSELNKLSDEDKKKILKKEEINIRQSIGEAVPTVIFRGIAKNINDKFRRLEKNETQIKKFIHERKLNIEENLKDFIRDNLKDLSYPELTKV